MIEFLERLHPFIQFSGDFAQLPQLLDDPAPVGCKRIDRNNNLDTVVRDGHRPRCAGVRRYSVRLDGADVLLTPTERDGSKNRDDA